MIIITRNIVLPRGGNDPVASFDRPEDATVERDTLLATYVERLGEPLDVVTSGSPTLPGPVAIGWLFKVPEDVDVPGSPEDFELGVIPMFDDPDTGERIILFLRLAEQGSAFQEMFDSGRSESLTIATLEQRHPEQPPRFVRVRTQQRSPSGEHDHPTEPGSTHPEQV